MAVHLNQRSRPLIRGAMPIAQHLRKKLELTQKYLTVFDGEVSVMEGETFAISVMEEATPFV